MTDLINGLGGNVGFGENILDRNDDRSTNAVDITSIFEGGLNFFGRTFTQLWVNNNGSVTFNGPRSQFTPDVITENSSNPEITPFFGDVDTRGGFTTASPGGTSTGSNLVYYDFDAEGDRFIVTWDDVGYYNSHIDLTNAFQLILTDRGSGDFDIEFRYESIDWTTGDASGGSDGLGGTPARAGFTAGTGNTNAFFELPQSGNQGELLNLDGQQYVFEVRSGNIKLDDIPELPPIGNAGGVFGDPHLVTLDGFGYDFHAAGEFVLLRSTDDRQFEVQARFTPVNQNATITQAVAIRLDGDVIMFDANDGTPVSVNGAAVNIGDLSSLTVGSNEIFRLGSQYTIVVAGQDGTVNDGDSQIRLSVLEDRVDIGFNLDSTFAGALEGLLGDGNGNPSNDVALANGTVLNRPLTFEDLYGSYRDDWRVSTASNSFFTYDVGESLDSFYLESHPSAVASLDNFTATQIAEAGTLAENSGLTPGTDFYDSAVLDYLITGNSSFFASATQLEGIIAEQASQSPGSDVTGNEIFRFFNTQNGAHFFTSNASERDAVLANLPHFSFEGNVFSSTATQASGGAPVYRFLNTENGVHFYTASETEANNVRNTFPHFNEEGVVYYAHTDESGDSVPLYRFLNTQTGGHFYTVSETERDSVISTIGHFNYEGIVYYVDPV